MLHSRVCHIYTAKIDPLELFEGLQLPQSFVCYFRAADIQPCKLFEILQSFNPLSVTLVKLRSRDLSSVHFFISFRLLSVTCAFRRLIHLIGFRSAKAAFKSPSVTKKLLS